MLEGKDLQPYHLSKPAVSFKHTLHFGSGFGGGRVPPPHVPNCQADCVRIETCLREGTCKPSSSTPTAYYITGSISIDRCERSWSVVTCLCLPLRQCDRPRLLSVRRPLLGRSARLTTMTQYSRPGV